MLSKKMAFSLTSLITIFALAFAVHPAMAAKFTVKFSAGDSSLAIPVNDAATTVTANLVVESDQDLPADIGPSVTLYVRDENGSGIVAAAASTATTAQVFGYTVTVTDDPAYAMRTARKRQLAVVVTLATDETTPRNVRSIVLTIPSLTTPDPSVATDDDANMSAAVSHTLNIRAAAAADTTSRPKVVSIQRLRRGSQSVVAAFQEAKIEPESFDVRIVLTEAGVDWTNDKIGDRIAVDGGKASNLVVGVPFARQGAVDGNGDAVPGSTLVPHPIEGRYAHDGDAGTPYAPLTGVAAGLAPQINVPLPSGDDVMYHQYRVTITPHKRSADFTLKVSVKAFHDGDSPYPNYYQPVDVGIKPNGREELRLTVAKETKNLTAGYRVSVPKDYRIPAGGYLIIAKNSDGSEIIVPPNPTKDPNATERRPAQMLYNVYEASTLPNLATQFATGVVVDVESSHKLVITEVMWGEDVSLNPSSNSQYIELYNPGTALIKTPDDDLGTLDVDERLTLVFYGSNEFSSIPAKVAVAATATTPATTALPGRVTDRVGTLDATGKFWSPVGIGGGGRSGTGEAEATGGRVSFVATTPIVSMYRGMEADTSVGAAIGAMKAKDGQMQASWMTSEGPKSANFDPTAIGIRHGTPGAATDSTVTPADTAAETKAKEDQAAADQKTADSTGTIPSDGQVYISEIMFAGGGTLPQWIEISNGSRTEEVNLSGWTLSVVNSAADADVSVGAAATFTIPTGTKIAPSGQFSMPSTLLVVTEQGRTNLTGPKAAGQVVNLAAKGSSTEVELILAGVTTRKYTLLSDMAFMITLAPGVPPATKPPAGETAAAKATRMANEAREAANRKMATDMVGNLSAGGSAAWALPMSEDGGRSSIIRRHIQVARGPAAPEDGTMEKNWVLASETSFAQVTHIRAASYYGAANDVGTPGFRPGGALPVELSHFRPTRDKATGAVVITWSTQSELNNAGFFIKRSQQRDGEFKVINATMVAGAGTTSEKQFYTYTDTTAQPNVVYYYQIEDVSLDGNRQTLTRGIRLKGHIGAAGKATTLWGELKTSHE